MQSLFRSPRTALYILMLGFQPDHQR